MLNGKNLGGMNISNGYAVLRMPKAEKPILAKMIMVE